MTQLRYRDLPAPVRDVDPGLRAMLLAAVSDAFYEARNAGRTMTSAADDAVERLLPIIASVDANAHGRGASEALQAAADEFSADMGDVWGGDAVWITSGNRVAALVADCLRERITGGA